MCSGRYVPGKSTTFGSGKIGKRVGKSASSAVSLIREKLYFRRPSRSQTLTEPERHARERAIERLRRHGAVLAEAFGLPLVSIDPEGPRVRRRLGICYADGRIRIRLHSLRSVELLKYSAMVDTLCHELAHLRHFDHGRRFWALYRRILAYARRHGI